MLVVNGFKNPIKTQGDNVLIYFTGDTHGDFSRFYSQWFTDSQNMTKNDYVIICGDCGAGWDDSEESSLKLDWLEERPFTVLFIDGNHDNFDYLNSLPEEDWHGGRVHKLRPSVIHLMRGYVFNIDGNKIFAFGGARSHDISDGVYEVGDIPWLRYSGKRLFRINHLSWWSEEMPNDAEMKRGRRNLGAVRNKVDYIITHETPLSVLGLINPLFKHDSLNDYLEEIKSTVSYKHWFFGHYHDTRNFGDISMLYRDIVPMPENSVWGY